MSKRKFLTHARKIAIVREHLEAKLQQKNKPSSVAFTVP
jgi:hypothetical protein